VAFVKGGSLVIKTVAGPDRSGPRVLGVVAPTALKGTWKVAIDLTKAVRSGRLEIRNGAGKLIRSLTVKASKDGSLRGITWNGRDKSGRRVAAGSYSYSLASRATDGTGTVRLVDGSLGPIGTIQVP
jgi:flagellar hook assembly protein FlgD